MKYQHYSCEEIEKVKAFASSAASPAYEMNADSKMPPKAPKKVGVTEFSSNSQIKVSFSSLQLGD